MNGNETTAFLTINFLFYFIRFLTSTLDTTCNGWQKWMDCGGMSGKNASSWTATNIGNQQNYLDPSWHYQATKENRSNFIGNQVQCQAHRPHDILDSYSFFFFFLYLVSLFFTYLIWWLVFYDVHFACCCKLHCLLSPLFLYCILV